MSAVPAFSLSARGLGILTDKFEIRISKCEIDAVAIPSSLWDFGTLNSVAKSEICTEFVTEKGRHRDTEQNDKNNNNVFQHQESNDINEHNDRNVFL